MVVAYSRYAFNYDDFWMWGQIINQRRIANGTSMLDIARFFPLASAELNLIMQFSTSPYAFFGFNALCTLATGILLWLLLRDLLPQKPHFRLIAALACFLNAGLITAIFGLCYTEDSLCLIFVALAFIAYKFPKIRCGAAKIALAILGLLLANAAIYLKEPVFLAIGAFSFCNLLCIFRFSLARFWARTFGRILARILRRENAPNPAAQPLYCDKTLIIYHALLCLSALVFAAIYLGYIVPQAKGFYVYDPAHAKGVLVYFKRFLRFLRTIGYEHPFILVLLPIIVGFRIYDILKGKDSINIFLDSLLVSGSFYLLAYFEPNYFYDYYYAPIYFIAAPPLAVYAARYFARLKWILLVCFLAFILQNAPLALHRMFYVKSQGVVLHDSLEFLRDYAAKRPNERVNVYFDGMGRARNYTIDWFFAAGVNSFLRAQYKTQNIYLRTNVLDPRGGPSSAGEGFASKETTSPKSGDLLIVSADSYKPFSQSYLDELSQKYELIYKTNSISLPNISLKAFVRFVSGKLHGDLEKNMPKVADLSRDLDTEAMRLKASDFNPRAAATAEHDRNYFRLPVNSYIFLVR